MGLRGQACGPTKGDENGFCLATALNESAALPFVIPRGCDFIGFLTFLTYLSLLFSASVLYETNKVTDSERSREPALSEVEGDLRFCRPVLEMFFDRAKQQILHDALRQRLPDDEKVAGRPGEIVKFCPLTGNGI
jgi:hypothetical protein